MKITKSQLRKIIKEEIIKETGFGADPWTEALTNLRNFLNHHKEQVVKVDSDEYVSLVDRADKELKKFINMILGQYSGSEHEQFIKDRAKPLQDTWSHLPALTDVDKLLDELEKFQELLAGFEDLVGYGFRTAGSDGEVSDDFETQFRQWRQSKY
jgi:hypothetical protein